MFLRLDDTSVTADLVHFLRERDYLAVATEPGVVEVVPINAASERGDRLRLNGVLCEWRRAHRDVTVELVGEDGRRMFRRRRRSRRTPRRPFDFL